MRFSEALRLGGMLTPRAMMVLYDQELGTACAVGRALIAVGVPPSRLAGRARSGFTETFWPLLGQEVRMSDLSYAPLHIRIWVGMIKNPKNRTVIECMNDATSQEVPMDQIVAWAERLERNFEARARYEGMPEAKIGHILGDTNGIGVSDLTDAAYSELLMQKV